MHLYSTFNTLLSRILAELEFWGRVAKPPQNRKKAKMSDEAICYVNYFA